MDKTKHMTPEEFRQRLKRGNKYGAKRTFIPGVGWFDSQGEAKAYGDLLLRQSVGEISHLQRQVKVTLSPRVTWKIDFSYIENGRQVYEDFKGHKTEDYIVKRNLLHDLIDAGEINAIYRESTAQGITEEYRHEK